MPLYQLGGVQFDVQPTALRETARETNGNFALKEIVGAPPTREFVGPGDERVVLRGVVFPKEFGGLGDLATLLAMPNSGEPQILIRGDGAVRGWFFVLHVHERQAFLARDGVGRVIEYEVELVKSPRAASFGAIASLLVSLL